MVTCVAFEITSGRGTREAGVMMGAGESLFNLFYNFVSYDGARVLACAENTRLPRSRTTVLKLIQILVKVHN